MFVNPTGHSHRSPRFGILEMLRTAPTLIHNTRVPASMHLLSVACEYFLIASRPFYIFDDASRSGRNLMAFSAFKVLRETRRGILSFIHLPWDFGALIDD